MSSHDETLRFIASTFRSVWALEVLLLLKRDGGLIVDKQLVSALRASDLVVSTALDELVSAGLASREEGATRYMPVNDDVARSVVATEKLYAARPDAVRRAIVSPSASGASAFADAFKLRRD
jgi:hypothetical protein